MVTCCAVRTCPYLYVIYGTVLEDIDFASTPTTCGILSCGEDRLGRYNSTSSEEGKSSGPSDVESENNLELCAVGKYRTVCGLR